MILSQPVTVAWTLLCKTFAFCVEAARECISEAADRDISVRAQLLAEMVIYQPNRSADAVKSVRLSARLGDSAVYRRKACPASLNLVNPERRARIAPPVEAFFTPIRAMLVKPPAYNSAARFYRPLNVKAKLCFLTKSQALETLGR
jgi:hypothetical protein